MGVGLLLAVAAAAGNALGSVLQRMASRHHDPTGDGWRELVALLRRPVWSAGIAAHVLGFVLQAVALTWAPISAVQPVLIAELPFTLILSALVLRTSMGRRAWGAVVVMAGGVALFLFCLVPRGGDPGSISAFAWVVGTGAVVAVLAVLVVLAHRHRGQHRAVWFGLATGVTYGYNAALLAGLGAAPGEGLAGLLATWQTYGVLVGGTVSFVFLQQALQAGDLVSAQPGITLANPLVALVWGFVVFGESVELDAWLLGATVGAAGVVVGTMVLTRTALPAVAAPPRPP